MTEPLDVELFERRGAEFKELLLRKYAELPAMQAYSMSAYPEFAPDNETPDLVPDADGDLVHNFGPCLALANPAPLAVHFHVDVSRDDAVRLLRKMADRIECDPGLLNGQASDNEKLPIH
ncbi:MAG: hypothetical protein ACRBC3_19045 [Burkholderiaceae bacterium]